MRVGMPVGVRVGVRAVLGGRYDRYAWEPVTAGMSGAAVWRLGAELYLKVGPGVAAEAERCAWLAGYGLPAPEVVEHGIDEEHGEWVLSAALAGRSAAEPWPAGQRAGVVDALADLARALHGLPVGECPFDRSLAVTLPLARAAVADGSAEAEGVEDPAGLLARLEAGWPAEGGPVARHEGLRVLEEDLAVCHGDFCLPNVLLDPVSLRVTGVIDLGRLGVADRAADLGLMTRSLADGRLNPQYGAAGAARFLDRYGGAVAEQRLAYYRELDLLA
ncbi:aminoglycoside phosphotransferase [Kitasatospora sp. MMS16-BH015]|nr:aminoglycoside phosphotransferase [Kitasatospora sp. MMS16-BH015]